MQQQYPHLSLQEHDSVFSTVSDPCMEYERLAFLEGLRLGMTLMMELAEEDT